jgi:hypothetical protein
MQDSNAAAPPEQRSGGVAIVNKEYHASYRQNLREKSNISSTYDPLFQAKMRPIDTIL